jgi:hypothetical protein
LIAEGGRKCGFKRACGASHGAIQPLDDFNVALLRFKSARSVH